MGKLPLLILEETIAVSNSTDVGLPKIVKLCRYERTSCTSCVSICLVLLVLLIPIRPLRNRILPQSLMCTTIILKDRIYPLDTTKHPGSVTSGVLLFFSLILIKTGLYTRFVSSISSRNTSTTITTSLCACTLTITKSPGLIFFDRSALGMCQQ